ncbi:MULTISPECIES: GNAT family N-acetyltransferase [Bacillus cereus group]|uniref:GNAT family N-acetyltransferase n=1 Tax=Bacillus cereus group TaxID=86661 RepID=UPI0008FDFF13|nr:MULTISPECIES: GNAT family N-acetyltransferase [Bacillus cereus group]MDG1623210.1 GNAT family N-acetyltransferase [Bacillus mobilis]MDX5836189.1 GNAT family N-acetyltransferase [Bacillus cereus group sp. BfR-BA-01700]MED4384922.1 GNAT family N-acetyltransferase [Bacillus mobilis]OJE37031.1 acetyltransferase [Bacillus mobilis]HDR7244827.1 GNAT family N-acetyltransferase [Bacillus mobilis]
MSIQLATSNDLEWINNQYKSIGFVPSDLKRDIVAIITYDNSYAGVGRLVQIDKDTIEMGGIFILPQFRGLQLAGELVSFLVETAKKLQVQHVYCLPFAELEEFYKKYSYTEVDTTKEAVHPIILKKYNWCLDHYDKHVLLCKL